MKLPYGCYALNYVLHLCTLYRRNGLSRAASLTNYVCHVLRGVAWNNKYFVILCAISQFYIVEGAEGAVTSVKRGSWTALGAQEAILEVLRQRNHSFRLLEGLRRSLNVTPVSFLGSGQFGRCFLVRDQQGVNMVLKTVLTIWNDDSSIEFSLRGEYRHFPILCFRALVSVIPVKHNARMALRWVRYLRHPI